MVLIWFVMFYMIYIGFDFVLFVLVSVSFGVFVIF